MTGWSIACGVVLLLFLSLSLFRHQLWYPNVALAASVMASFFLLAGALGPTLWDYSAPLVDAGVTIRRSMTEAESLLASRVYFLCAIGPLGVALFLAIRPRSRLKSNIRFDARNPAFRTALGAFTILILLLWIASRGPNLWTEDVYLADDSYRWLQRVANPLAPASIAGAAFLAVTADSERIGGVLDARVRRITWLFVCVVWWVLLATKGTRLAILAGAAVALVALWPRRWRPSRVLFMVIGISVMALASVQYVLLARRNPHGLARFGALSDGSYGVIPFSPQYWPDSLAFLAKNFSGFVYVTQASVSMAPQSQVIVANMNPLPGQRAVGSIGGGESFLPWVPLSTAGELFGAFGGGVLVAFTTGLAICLTVAARLWGDSTAGQFIALAAYGFLPLTLVWTAQYSTRSAFRVAWLVVSLAVAALVVTTLKRLGQRDLHRSRWRQPFYSSS